MRYISRNWFWICLGLIGTAAAIQQAYEDRGALMYGGEWLVLPLVLMVVELVTQFRNMVRELCSMEDTDYGEEFRRDYKEIPKRWVRSERRRSRRGEIVLFPENGSVRH